MVSQAKKIIEILIERDGVSQTEEEVWTKKQRQGIFNHSLMNHESQSVCAVQTYTPLLQDEQGSQLDQNSGGKHR